MGVANYGVHHTHTTPRRSPTVDTSWKNWALTIGSTIIAIAVTTGHGHIVADAVTAVGDIALWLIRPLGPQ